MQNAILCAFFTLPHRCAFCTICTPVLALTALKDAFLLWFNYSAISVEMYYIFATIWGREIYTLYGILMLVFAIELSVSACVAVALTYFQLSNEDYR